MTRTSVRSVAGFAFARFLLDELFDDRRAPPRLLVEDAVDLRRLLDLDRGDRIAIAGGIALRRVLMHLRGEETRQTQDQSQDRGRRRCGRCRHDDVLKLTAVVLPPHTITPTRSEALGRYAPERSAAHVAAPPGSAATRS